jgi:hypothetical protein
MRRRFVLMLAWGLGCFAGGNAWGAYATAAAAERIEELRGDIRCDAGKQVGGVDLVDYGMGRTQCDFNSNGTLNGLVSLSGDKLSWIAGSF